jgi:hypothetical protein
MPSNRHVGIRRLVVEKLGYCTAPFVKHAREEMAFTGWAFFPQHRPSVCPMFTTRELLSIYPSGCPAFKSPLRWASFFAHTGILLAARCRRRRRRTPRPEWAHRGLRLLDRTLEPLSELHRLQWGRRRACLTAERRLGHSWATEVAACCRTRASLLRGASQLRAVQASVAPPWIGRPRERGGARTYRAASAGLRRVGVTKAQLRISILRLRSRDHIRIRSMPQGQRCTLETTQSVTRDQVCLDLFVAHHGPA